MIKTLAASTPSPVASEPPSISGADTGVIAERPTVANSTTASNPHPYVHTRAIFMAFLLLSRSRLL
jgi:hypothetical protein